jgi:hypothetical protein
MEPHVPFAHVWERVLEGVGEQRTKAIRCGACYYSIVLNAHRITSMADTDIDAVKKRNNSEGKKQYRLKRKLLMQRQASTSTETELAEKQKKA